jgi:tetratricopeptide (TPR) repeat protein
LLPANEPKVIIFDAIDQSSRPQDLLQAIYDVSHEIPPNIKFLITSRSGGEIEKFVETIQHSVFSLNISLADSLTMKSFFSLRLKDVRDLQKYIDHLVNRADGFFIWADILCTFVTSPYIGDPSKALEMILFSQDSTYSTERPLDDLYSAALDHLFPLLECDDALNKTQSARANFTTVFAAMFTAFGPLNEQALEELVGEAPKGIISSLRSLQIRIPNDGRIAPAADLFHASFLDFIVSKDRCPDTHFRIEPVEAHKEVATLCIQLLLKTFKENHAMRYAELSVAVRYATENWASHAAECISKLDRSDIPSEWKTFLETHGDRWGELLLSIIADTVPASSHSQGRGKRDDLLSRLNGKFLKLYKMKPLAGHLQKIVHVNQVLEHFSWGRKVWAQQRLALLLGNLPKCVIPANWTEAMPCGNLNLPSSFHDLATFFYSRFLSNESIDDLDEAISLSQAARSIQPAGHIILDNLSIYLLSRFYKTGRYQDLKDLVDLYQVHIPRRPLNLARSIENFVSSLRSIFEQAGSKEDLEKIIELNEDTFCLPSSSPGRPNLTLCFEPRNMSLETLGKAIGSHEKALGERDRCHSDYPLCLIVLAHSLRLRGIHIGSKEDLDRALALSQEALKLYSDRDNCLDTDTT